MSRPKKQAMEASRSHKRGSRSVKLKSWDILVENAKNRYIRAINNVKVAKIVRTARLEKGYKLTELARQLGVSKQAIFDLESGQHGVGKENWAKLEKILEVNFTERL
jgi:ribosome-binding protein aMBF1 (putative translation factor)